MALAEPTHVAISPASFSVPHFLRSVVHLLSTLLFYTCISVPAFVHRNAKAVTYAKSCHIKSRTG